MKFHFFISDVDGTLLDRMPIFTKAFTDIVARFGVLTDEAERYYLEKNGIPLPQQFQGVLELHGVRTDNVLIQNLVNEFWTQTESKSPKLFPAVRGTLVTIKKLGLKLCFSSGSDTGSLECIFKTLALPYNIIMGSDVTPKGDHHIELFAEFCGVSLEEFCGKALYVGDGPADMQLASRNHIFAVGITNTSSVEQLRNAGANELIASFDQVLEIIKRPITIT